MGTRLISAHAHQEYRVIMNKPHTDLKCTLGMFVRTFVTYSYILVSAFACICTCLRLSAYRRLDVRTRMDLCAWTRLYFKDFQDVLIEWNSIKVMGYIMGAVSGSGLLTA